MDICMIQCTSFCISIINIINIIAMHEFSLFSKIFKILKKNLNKLGPIFAKKTFT